MEVTIDTVKFATCLAEAAAEMKASDIAILDMRGLVYYTDMFVLCTGTSPRQVRAIADSVRAAAKEHFDIRPMGVEGTARGQWVLVDFGDAVVHVFEHSMRGFYDLDGLWEDAPRLEAPRGEEPSEPTFFS